MAENEEERTEQATQRRRQRAREQGQVARSRELTAMATMGGGLLVLALGGAATLRGMSGLTVRLLGLEYGRDATTVLRAASVEVLWVLAPFLLVAVAFAVLASLAQGGVVFKPLAFDAAKLNPLKGLRGMFSLSALPGIVKSVLKFVIGAVLFYGVMQRLLVEVPHVMALGIDDIRHAGFSFVWRAVIAVFAVYLVIALADYGIERWRFERSLRMTKEEIREEHKESEGDPHVKARIKTIQRDLARRRMMEQVPKATVVITNPTHIAVALLYRTDDQRAPRIIAKGEGFIAERIKEIARTHGVPMVEDRPLARALVKGKLDSFIPVELYQAVAKILAHIYRLRGTAA